MVSKNTKVFNINGTDYRFNFSSFQSTFDSYCKRNHIRKGELEEIIAEKLNVSKEAIHNWRSKSNGPSEISMIKRLGEVLCIDYFLLLKKCEDCEKTMKCTDLQTESIKRVYNAIIEFLDEFFRTDGFNDWWVLFSDKGVPNDQIEALILEKADKKVYDVELVLKKEYFYLHELEIYDALEAFIYNDLFNTYDGKCSYAYRFECVVEDKTGHRGNSADEDYLIALNKINGIIKSVA